MVATKPLSKRADFNSALMLGVVFAPGLSRGNRPGDTKRDSGHGNQHLLPAHDSLQRLSHRRFLCRHVATITRVNLILTFPIP
jgi:hypothetical protein